MSIASALAVSGAVIVLGGPAMGVAPSFDALSKAGLGLAALGIFYLVPVVLISMWGAQILNPAAMGFLLTAEIVAGVGSSALFLDQPFGIFEVAGTILIISGAMIEVASAPSTEDRNSPG